jgi:predicted Fe-Mo cluster-binding NifX family protein
MKIAVATNDQVRVTGHLGRCRSFLVYETNDSEILKRELRENTFTHHMTHPGEEHGHHHHGEGEAHSHQGLVDGLNDCSHVIFQSGGWRVVEDLKNNNITPVLTDENLADEAVLKFLKGELVTKEDNSCNHH